MKKHILSILFIALGLTFTAQNNPVPAPKQTKSVLIMNAVAHLGDGTMIENSAVGFKDGVITMVADARVIRLAPDAYDTTIYASGMHLYPGFIATNSTLGLHEIDAVRAMNDMSEAGTFKPSVRSAIAYNTDSEIIPTVRFNGVLMGQIVPRGGVISGVSSVMQFDAWNWEDAIVREDDGIHLNWPQVYHRHYDKGKVAIEKVKSYDQQLAEIQVFFSEAKAYCATKTPSAVEVRFEGLRGVFGASQTLYVHADDVKAISEALRFKREMMISKMVIVGGYDAWMIADELKAEKVGVMLRRVHELPMLNEEDVSLPFKLPSMLYEAGVEFCLQNEGDMERMGTRNLPFYAGTAVAYGLPYEEAVKSLSLGAANLLGIGDKCGSITSGKDATLFISAGDALDMRTNNVVYAFIQGRMIKLDNKQKALYERYLAK